MEQIDEVVKENLTTEHELYISVGFKNPMKPTTFRDIVNDLLFEHIGYMQSWGVHTKGEYIGIVDELAEENKRLKKLLNRCLAYVEPEVEQHGYGFFPGGNPNDFFPDDDNTSEQLKNWNEACKRWKNGDQTGEPSSHRNISDKDGNRIAHVTIANLGMGEYRYVDGDAEDIVNRIKALLPKAIEPNEQPSEAAAEGR